MRGENEINVSLFVAVSFFLTLIVLALITHPTDYKFDCASDLKYYLTPYQRQTLLDKTDTPSFGELEKYCIENSVTFEQIIKLSEKLAKFR
jgi:hypothetical protein